MMDRWKWILLAGGAVTLAFWAGQRTGAPAPGAGTERAPAPPAASPRPIIIERAPAGSEPGAPGALGSLGAEELRAIVQEELARAGKPADVAQEDPDRVAARAEAMTQASALVEHGISDGVWSVEERNALRAQLPDLGEREIHAVLSPLFQAINAQRLRLDGPPI